MLEGEQFWPRLRWAVKALIAQGKKGEAFRLAENAREANAGYREIDLICEELLLSCGCADEAYSSYGLRAHQKGTNLAWFRAVAKKYPDKPAEQILKDLSELTPGREGSWFAAAKEAKLFDLAIIFANMAPCAPQTLSRAARDHVEKNPGFASEAAITALRWIVDGHGYEISGLDVSLAASRAMQAAANCDREEDVRNRIQTLLARDTPNARFAAQFVARDLDSSGGSGVR
jgi:hypothetical protein